jgi:cytochrome c-type biogenesis protein CcmE
MALSALQSNISYFFSPTQVKANESPADHVFRLGGLVKEGSVQRQDDGLTVTFDVTDLAETVTVAYTGILPDLFKEGQGVVTKGRMGSDGRFLADEVLAKHDEEYMPPEVADTLKTAHAEGMTDAATQTAQSGAAAQ